jgi:hypothetical protein
LITLWGSYGQTTANTSAFLKIWAKIAISLVCPETALPISCPQMLNFAFSHLFMARLYNNEGQTELRGVNQSFNYAKDICCLYGCRPFSRF